MPQEVGKGKATSGDATKEIDQSRAIKIIHGRRPNPNAKSTSPAK